MSRLISAHSWCPLLVQESLSRLRAQQRKATHEGLRCSGGSSMDLSFSGQAFDGEPEASLGGEPLGTSAVERGSEADGATKDKKLNSYALPFFGRVGAWLIWQGEDIQTEQDKSKRKRIKRYFRHLLYLSSVSEVSLRDSSCVYLWRISAASCVCPEVKKASAKNFQLVVNGVCSLVSPKTESLRSAMQLAELRLQDQNTIFLMFGKISKARSHCIAFACFRWVTPPMHALTTLLFVLNWVRKEYQDSK